MTNAIFILILLAASGVLIYTMYQQRKLRGELDSLAERDQNLQDQIDEASGKAMERREAYISRQSEIERQSTEMGVSIRYAECIQRSLIPGEEAVRKAFPESFVYFEPKDVVSGDFYLMQELTHNTIMVVADCTGHGVPGGFLSMLGIAGLKQILPQYSDMVEIPTGEILTKLREFVLQSLSAAIETEHNIQMEVSDGMDMTMMAISKDRSRFNYSLADHNIYVCRGGGVEKLKGDRMPIGRHPLQDREFKTLSYTTEPGDMVYLCSDGVQDQIGGPEDCKFLTKRLSAMVKEHAPMPIDEQRARISKIIDDWKEGYEQFDDQTLIGIRIR